jgi:Protein of unknown function (DUF3311)
MSMSPERVVGRARPRRPVPPDFLPPPLPVQRDHPQRTGWHWLLLLPIVLPLITPLYNRLDPRLFGLPFFYWCQLAFVFLDVGVITLVYQLTRRRP